jgi:hypothetical protein
MLGLVWENHFFPPLDIVVVPVLWFCCVDGHNSTRNGDSIIGLCLKAADLLLYDCVYQTNRSTERITLRGTLQFIAFR